MRGLGRLALLVGLAALFAGCGGELYEDPKIDVTVDGIEAYAGPCGRPEPLGNATTVCATWNLTVDNLDDRELPLDGTLYYGDPWVLFDEMGQRYDTHAQVRVIPSRAGSDTYLDPGAREEIVLETETPYGANLTHVGYEAHGTEHPVNTSVPAFEIDEIEPNVTGEILDHRVEEEDCTWVTHELACHHLTVRLHNGNERFTVPLGAWDGPWPLPRGDGIAYSPRVPPGETREFEIDIDAPEGEHLGSLELEADWMFEPLRLPVPERALPDHPARVHVNWEPPRVPAPDCFDPHPTACSDWTVQVWNRNLSEPADVARDAWILARDEGETYPVERVEGPPMVQPGDHVNVTIVFGEPPERTPGTLTHPEHLLYDSDQVREPITVGPSPP